jgi:phospholipase A1
MQSKRESVLFTAVLLFAAATIVPAAEDPEPDLDPYQKCLLEKLRTANDETPISKIREACLPFLEGSIADDAIATAGTEDDTEETTPLGERLEETEATEEMRFVITPYKPNYLLVGYNSNPNTGPFEEAFPDRVIDFQSAEVKFQISFMFPIVKDIFGNNGDLYFAYTNRSFWQLFDEELSAPFRETNHEPEFWLQFDSDFKILGLTNRLNSFGYIHQSNGRSDPLSRSWNRLFANFIFERGNLALSIKPWIIIMDLTGNEDIQDYMGNFEIRAAYKWHKQTFSLMSRNNLQSWFSRGAVQLDWSFPIYHRLRGYTQYFYGYGESLIDYNYRNNTLGVGISFTDYF